MGPEYWKPGSPTALKKCSERVSNSCTDETDGCCGPVACTYCLEWQPESGQAQLGIGEDFGTHWSGTIAGVTWRGFWERNYESGECEFVVTLDGEEIYRKSCYEGQSCRDSSDSVAVALPYMTGVMTWTKHLSRPLEYIQDEDTNCTVHFCDDCECSCECLCVTISEFISEGVYETHTGEICDTAYDCEPPLWEGTIEGFELSLALGRDEYGRCIITATVNSEEQEPVLFPGCGDAGDVTITLADTSTITVRCKKCDCNPVSPPCCGRTDLPDVLYLTITDLVNCTCNDWLGVVIELSKSRHDQADGLTLWAGCLSPGPCTTINGVETQQSMVFLLSCTAGEIGQQGTVTDFLLQKGGVPGEGNQPCPDDLTGIIDPATPAVVTLQVESTCDPLRLVYRIVDDSLWAVHCQDPMAPPGVNEWEITITE